MADQQMLKVGSTLSASVKLWKPVGKEPSGLWQGECQEINEIFVDLYRHFEQHESYRFAFKEWDPTQTHSNMNINRISKWLARYNLIIREECREPNKDDGKQSIVRYLKPTEYGQKVLVEGGEFSISCSYSSPIIVGLGKPYALKREVEEWLDSQYNINKVAKSRRAKWWSEYNSLCYHLLNKRKEDFMVEMRKWLADKLGSYKRRGNHIATAKAQTQLELHAMIQKPLFPESIKATQDERVEKQ
jgi:hypothetical protein